MGNTHFSGPILINGGPAAEAPIHTISPRSNYKSWIEEFSDDVADITALETLGWAETAITTPTAATVTALKENGYLAINPGTKADSGSQAQLNATPTAVTASPHKTCGPLTSTATLMDGRELFFEMRFGVMSDTTAWDGKALFGWCVTDTALLNATTGAAAIGTGGGIGFHIGETGVLSYFTQSTTTYNAVDTGISILALDAAATFQWYTLGFRARWTDASAATGQVEFYRDGSLIGTVVDDMPMTSTQTYSVSYSVLNGPARDSDVAIDYIITGVSRPGYTIP